MRGDREPSLPSRVSLARTFFLAPIYFLAPATQARIGHFTVMDGSEAGVDLDG